MGDGRPIDAIRRLRTQPAADGRPGVSAFDLADAMWLAPLLDPAPPAGLAQHLVAGPLADQDPSSPDPAAPDLMALELTLEPAPGMAATMFGTPVRSPVPRALPDALPIGRALRRLKRRVAARGRVVLDEDATAHEAAESGICAPKMRPATERWLQVELVVDVSATMRIWDRTVHELLTLLEQHGAFRLVRAWQIDTDAQQPALTSYRRHPVRPGAGGALRSPRELIDPGGRSAVLVVTDGIGGAWRRGAMDPILSTWRSAATVSLIDVLPAPMRHRTGFQPTTVTVRAEQSRTGMARLRIEPRDFAVVLGTDVRDATMLMSLDRNGMALWAALVTGAISGPVAATAAVPWPADRAQAADLAQPVLPAAGMVARFRATASPEAFRLACWLAVPELSLPVMRLVQWAKMPHSGVPVLAEVVLSGLIRTAGSVPAAPGGDADDPDLIRYEFLDGVAEILLEHLTQDDTLAVKHMLDNVAAFVAQHASSARHFQAVLAGGAEAAATQAAVKPFARLAPAAAAKLARVPSRQPISPMEIRIRPVPPVAVPPPVRPVPDFVLDPQAPLVYVSCARGSKPMAADAPEARFYNDLMGFVSAFGVWAAPGYMDLRGTADRAGEAEYLRAAGTCQVFIPLLSATYVRSPVCAMEWDAFAQRPAYRRANQAISDNRAIVPVLWRVVPAPLPPAIAHIAPFEPGTLPEQAHATRYQARGLEALQAQDPPAYEVIVWKLALRIAQFAASHWTRPIAVANRMGLRTTFVRRR